MEAIPSLLSQISSAAVLQLSVDGAQNSSSLTNTTSPDGLFATAYSLWSFLLTSPAVRDGAKLFLLGGAIESARRLLSLAWSSFVESFFLTAEFDERDESYTWIMFWLSKEPSWTTSRNIRVSTIRYGHSGVADAIPGEEEDGKPIDPSRRLSYTPTHNRTHYMWFKGAWMSVTRSQTQGDMWNRNGDERLTITMFTRNIGKFDALLLEAKRAYKQESEGRINIYVADTYNDWSLAGSRPKRPLTSVVLDKGIKEHLLADAKDFMDNEKWYAERGIPWRRGYLLHGYPGTGKTSLIHALAGELDLDIYVVSLSKRGLDDSSLNELISKLPSRSLALMEDIDAAFFRGLTRESDANSNTALPGQPANASAPPPPPGAGGAAAAPTTGVTLSGLLGAIDGVAAQEGRLLFATTNKYTALDPALTRPGRLDVHVRFDFAGKWQVEELFRCFFPPRAVVVSERHLEDEDYDEEATVVAESESDRKSTGSVTPPESEKAASVDEKALALATPSRLQLKEEISKSPSAIFTVDTGAHCPVLTCAEVDRLARAFATHIPDREFSMASIQGLLMQYKTRPFLAVQDADGWVEEERKKKRERDGKKEGEDKKDGDKDGAGKKAESKGENVDAKNLMTIPSSWFWSIAAM